MNILCLRNDDQACVPAGGESPLAGEDSVPVVRFCRLVPLLLVGSQLR